MRNHLLRMLYLGTLLLVMLMLYLSTRPSEYIDTATRIERQALLGQTFFGGFSIFCVIGMGLIAPILTSTAINSERLGNTLHVLLMTPITSWQIVSGKLFSRLLIALMLIGLSLPVLAVVRLLGGVELSQMIAVLCLCTAFAISSAAIGLFFSALINRAYLTILLAYGAQIVLYILLPLIIIAIAENNRAGNSMWLIYLISAIHPIYNVAFISISGSPMRWSGEVSQWLPGVLVQLSLALSLLVAASWIVRRHGRRLREPFFMPPAPALPGEYSASHTLPAESGGGKLRAVGDNPVFWRELRQPVAARRWTVLAIVVVAALLLGSYACFASFRALRDREIQVAYAFVFQTLYWLLAAVISATAIAQEKESDTWTVLLASPLSPSQIVLGKFMGLCRRMLVPTIFVGIHYCFFVLGGVISMWAVVVAMAIMIFTNLLWAATGIYLSLRVKKVTTAVIFNLLLALGLYAGAPVLLYVVGEWLARTDRWGDGAMFLLPYVYVEAGMQRFYGGILGPYMIGRSINLPLDTRVGPSDFIQIVVAFCIIHLALAALILSVTIRRFNRIVGRATEDVR